MDNMQDPLLRPLQSPPLKHRGFTDALRRRIDDRINEPDRAKPVRRLLAIPAGGALLAAIIAVVFFAVEWKEPVTLTNNYAVSTMSSSHNVSEEASVPDVHIRSGLLIGLRDKDNRYRTLWIAPVRNELRLVAEGDGLLIPYQIDFWKLDAADEGGGTVITARAAGTEPSALLSETEGSAAGPRMSIRFAGQQYVALQISDPSEQTNIVTTLGAIARNSFAPVRLGQLTDEAAEQHVKEETSIAVRRELRQWRLHPEAGGAKDGYRFSSAVLRHDGACANWDEIESIAPGARDALCSPTADMVAVLTEEELQVYPHTHRIVHEKRLNVPLREEEQFIMAEWATDDYIGKWNELTVQFLR